MNTIKFLADLNKFGICLGLERIEQILQDLGNPEQKVPIIHIAGTNGKGSVCAFLSKILIDAGYRVGCYTSPHLVDWRERITINGDWIKVEQFEAALAKVNQVILPDAMPTQFEVVTAAAWWYFAQQQVDIAVIETGLGGRLDATNVVERPLVSVITSISMDHWQRLGNSLTAIASEKAGPAISYGLGQGATIVAAIWGIFIWKEFKDAPKSIFTLLYIMLACYALGLAFIILAR
jgi:dihydrofolate synthase/folylpolyglutamate synthase